jgi:hypothetical protein
MYFFGFSGNKKITSQECRPLGSSEWWDFGTKNRIYAKVGLGLGGGNFDQNRLFFVPRVGMAILAGIRPCSDSGQGGKFDRNESGNFGRNRWQLSSEYATAA